MTSFKYKPVHGGYPGVTPPAKLRTGLPIVPIRPCEYCTEELGGGWICTGKCTIASAQVKAKRDFPDGCGDPHCLYCGKNSFGESL